MYTRNKESNHVQSLYLRDQHKQNRIKQRQQEKQNYEFSSCTFRPSLQKEKLSSTNQKPQSFRRKAIGKTEELFRLSIAKNQEKIQNYQETQKLSPNHTFKPDITTSAKSKLVNKNPRGQTQSVDRIRFTQQEKISLQLMQEKSIPFPDSSKIYTQQFSKSQKSSKSSLFEQNRLHGQTYQLNSQSKQLNTNQTDPLENKILTNHQDNASDELDSEEVQLILLINLSPDQKEKIEIRERDSPRQVASKFINEHNLSVQLYPKLVQMIKSKMFEK